MLKQIPISDLRPGMMVTQIIAQSGPVKIRKVGFIRSPDMIRGLKDMGVSLVEVDLEQSLSVELESDEPELLEVVAQEEVLSPKTATQRLVMSNRQAADADRQLSQQFYSASFMPGVDQMPSKWSIYGKPYVILLVFIVLGVLIGGVSSYTILTVTNNSNVSLSKLIETSFTNTPSSVSSPSETQGELSNTTNVNNTIAENTASQIAQMQNAESNSLNTKNPSTAESSFNSGNENISKTVAGYIHVKPLENSNPLRQESPPIQRQLVNGVLLEAGQQVLGYQGSSDDVETSNDRIERNTTNTASEKQSANIDKPINSELFRRIQRVAKDVDNQPSEPEPALLKVTDLNDLPRIDQLSPALLTQMPSMSFSAHMYASNAQDRWVRVNSKRLGEGDMIANKVMLKRIESEKVVLEYKGTEFTMNALTDW